MLFLKRIVTVLALVYLLLALLILFFPFVRSSTVGIFSVYSLPMEINMLLGFTWASVFIMGLLLVFENLDSGLLRRSASKQEQKINELKAQLFDTQKALAAAPTMHSSPPGISSAPGATAYPPTYNTPPTTPPTY
ncbi:hypothetical protein [Hymenobacter cheonanensis]|uniref:hypothetical protein n=1 Tax=Hymenobacter sp. CA2-7 TaxID=3063993 RepID=UPI002714452F|nr:hypothetical protein [Hymenobacter sp. CA2-7]MDO7887558.1 hypothetical protein [Hymenobacter sp. CA2-7]